MINKSTYLRTFSIALICLISLTELTAQDNGIYEISKNNYSSKVSNTKGVSNERQLFYELAFNLKTTAYLENNSVKNIYGEGSVQKITLEDTKSFDILKNNATNYKDAELLIINVSSMQELKNSIDLTSVTELSNLKYVFIKCIFKCQIGDIENYIKVNPDIRVFYNAENPS